MIYHHTCIMQIDYEILCSKSLNKKTWVIFKRFFILIHNVYWTGDYRHLQNRQILKKEKLY